MRITYFYLMVTMFVLPCTMGNAFATTPQPWQLAQSTTMPPRDNSPSIAVPAAPQRQPLTNPALPTVRPVPRAMPAPTLHTPTPPGLHKAPPRRHDVPRQGLRPAPHRRRDLSTQNRRNRAVVLCNQRQITCKNRCNARSMGTMRTMCSRQCAAQFQRCVDRANTLP